MLRRLMIILVATILTMSTVSVPALQSSQQFSTQLITAIQSGDAERVELLLDLGARADGTVFGPDRSVTYPLLEAVRAGNSEIVKLLLERGATPDVFVITAAGVLSPIEEALKLDDLEIARLLRDAIQARR